MFWGCFNGSRKDKSYAYLPNLAGNQMGQNYDKLKLKFSTSEDKLEFCLLSLSMFRTLIHTGSNLATHGQLLCKEISDANIRT